MSARLLSLVLLLVAGLLGAPGAAVAVPTPSPSPAPMPEPSPVTVAEPEVEGHETQEPEVKEPPALVQRRPRISGELRWPRTLRAHPGRWQPRHDEVQYRWLRDGAPIPGARGRSYRIRPEDVGHRLKVQVRARAEGHRWAVATSPPSRRVQHRVKTRRVVTYSVETRGRLAADVRVFARQAQETFDDPRGWRNSGVEFRRVRRGGQFSLVLAEAAWLPRFSRECSPRWSCRVGRHVVINQTRWLHASPAWNGAGRSVRDYRHMVVNHETGHWLGRGHRGCPRRGQRAPVMMQQSKGTDGCRLNPWPRGDEL